MKPGLSLKGRALQCVAQREHSRVELRRKLMTHVLAASKREADAADGAQETAESEVEAVLDWMQSHSYLSDERFAESRVHARASRFGNLRIRHELSQHGLTPSPEAAQQLRQSELARALEVRQRKFPVLPATPAERLRQARFLAGRGFSPEVTARVMRLALNGLELPGADPDPE